MELWTISKHALFFFFFFFFWVFEGSKHAFYVKLTNDHEHIFRHNHLALTSYILAATTIKASLTKVGLSG